jgi:hypothetical protein
MRWPGRHVQERAATPSPAIAEAGAADATVHASPGLAALLGGLAADGGGRILDLGPAVPANLAVYTRFATTVRFADLLRVAAPAGGDAANRASLTDERLGSVLPDGEPPYDVVLAWDVLNYLTADTWRAIVARLTARCRPGARLFAMIATGRTVPAAPLRYEIVGDDHLAYRAADPATCASATVAPAEVEKRLAPFRVVHSVVLRHGVHEYLFALRVEPSARV